MLDDHDQRRTKSDFWDDCHAADAAAGTSRQNTSRKWLTEFWPALTRLGVGRVLDLGCGLGYDALALAARGFDVTGIDYSSTAIAHARQLAGQQHRRLDFQVHDLLQPLPFPDAHFEAVVSNLVLHAFPDPLVRTVLAEVRRCLQPRGWFLFHVNSTADIPARIASQAPEEQLGPRLYRLAAGQWMHFFSEEYCRELLAGWTIYELAHIQMPVSDGGTPKHAIRCIAQAPSENSSAPDSGQQQKYVACDVR